MTVLSLSAVTMIADAVVAGTMVVAVLDTVGVDCNASIAAFVAAGIEAVGTWYSSCRHRG